MKLCLACAHAHDSQEWRCPSCGASPPTSDGIPLFAPDLAEANDGYPEDLEPPEIADDNFWRRARHRMIAWVLRTRFADARSFFEVGCGTGNVLRSVHEAFPALALTGSEVYAAPLVALKRHLPSAGVLQMDARRVPFRDEFDVAGAFDVIEHIDDDVGVLRQLAAAVRPGGGVVVTVPQHPWLWSQRDVRLCHKRRYTRSLLVRRVVEAGLRVELVRSFVTAPLPLLALQAARNRRPRPGYDPHAELRAGSRVTTLLDGVLRAEFQLIRAGADFPAGGSLLVAARRPPA